MSHALTVRCRDGGGGGVDDSLEALDSSVEVGQHQIEFTLADRFASL